MDTANPARIDFARSFAITALLRTCGNARGGDLRGEMAAMLDFKDLRCFVTVYDLQGFARAAVNLNTVQSNVSARIGRLEDEIGGTLFDRMHRGIRPTAKGEIMYRYATRVLTELSELEAAVGSRRVA